MAGGSDNPAGQAPPGPTSPRFDISDVLGPTKGKRLGRLPHLVRLSLGLVWAAARGEFVLATAFQAAAAAGLGAQLLLGRRLLDAVVHVRGTSAFRGLIPVLIGLGLVTALVSFAGKAGSEQQRVLAELVTLHALRRVIDVAIAVDLVQFEDPIFHDRLQRARANAAMRPLQLASGVLGLVAATLTLAGIGGALLVLSPLLLAIVMLGAVPAWFADRVASRASYAHAVEQTERQRRRGYLFTVLTDKSEAKEVRAFGLGQFLTSRHDHLYEQEIADLRRLVSTRVRLGLVGGLATSAILMATVGVLVWLVTAGRMPLDNAGAAAAAVVLLGQRLRGLGSSLSSLYEGSLFLEDFTSFTASLDSLRAQRATTPPPAGFDLLEVDDLTFRYPSREAPAVDAVSLHIRRGEIVALVGENGSGKTTLAKLLAGLYTPEAGSVRWDGVCLADCDPDLVRDEIAVIFQDFTRYQLTVRENIGAGRVERYDDLDSIVEASRRAGAHRLLTDLVDGYETRLGPEYYGGSDLSVGQWQRVALARAFFRDAPFIILDEPTASLDPRAEADLFDNIRTLYRGRTVLLISHRFSSVRNADRIYVMHGGRIVESGSHQALMADGGRYAELFSLQASAYLDRQA